VNRKSTDNESPNRAPNPIQISPEISTPKPLDSSPTNTIEESQTISVISKDKQRNGPGQTDASNAAGRTDRGSRHVVGGAVLSRSLLHALEKRGENIRSLRKMEKELRTTLKPEGALGRLFFDRFWSSVLRLILVARLEESGLASPQIAAKKILSVPSLREGRVPVLVVPEDGTAPEGDSEKLFDSNSAVIQTLNLIARYDRSAAREMYRTLSLLLIMRADGQSGLESWVRATAGIKNEITKEGKNG
jgi:hypothetical protein